MRIVVTGGAGFIGSHITDAFTGAGHEVVALDSLWSHGGGRRENVNPRATFVQLDVRDAGVRRFFEEFKPDVVCHHAAQHSVAIGMREPQFDANVNILGTLNVLDAAVAAGVRKVIFASSAATYGDLAASPLDETSPQQPVSPYGISKMVVEHYLRFYRAEHGLDYTALRYGNVYGPRQDPAGEAGVIAIFIDRFLNGQGVRIDWDGEQSRDYVYVGDVVRANVAALDRGSGEIYVIGTGRQTSVNALCASLHTVTGRDVPISYAPRRPGDMRTVFFNPAKAARELGWRAETDLDTGLAATVAHVRERRIAGAAPAVALAV